MGSNRFTNKLQEAIRSAQRKAGLARRFASNGVRGSG